MELIQQFDLLASSLGGVAKLRELILSLAVRGKLVPQNPADEPASVLLQKIRAEKERLIAEGKIKKDKPLAPISDEEKPFDLPEGWEWVRLPAISHDWGQKVPNGPFSYIDVGSIDNQAGKITTDIQLLDTDTAPSRARKIVKRGTVIYSTVRPYLLNIAIVEQEHSPEPIASTAFAILHPHSGIHATYIFYYLRSSVFKTYVESKMIGVAYPAINDANFFNGLIPVPPCAEQSRIVAKVDELMALCDRLEGEQGQAVRVQGHWVEAALAQLASSADAGEFARHWHHLAQHFDTLFTTPDSITQLEATLLQLAVRGKLVPQDPSDEPASTLLQKIRTEKDRLIAEGKIKKDKPLPPISDEEIPFELPEGWLWVRLGSLLAKIGAGSTPLGGKEVYTPSGIKFLRSQNVWNDGLRLTDVAYIPVEIHQKMSGTVVQAKDILFNITGASIGRCALVPDSFDEANVSQHVTIIRPTLPDVRHFLHLVLISQHVQQTVMNVQVGVSREGLSIAKLGQFIVPLPPLLEQSRIVAKLESLFTLTAGLKAQLAKAQQMQVLLADVLLETSI